jgi:hypothetical protein
MLRKLIRATLLYAVLVTLQPTLELNILLSSLVPWSIECLELNWTGDGLLEEGMLMCGTLNQLG